jgi:hypothetical protein
MVDQVDIASAVSNTDGSIVYFEDEQQSPFLFSTQKTAKTKPSKLPPSQEEEMDMLPIAEWGTQNDFPEQARRAKESNPDLISALDWKARALYGGGLKYVIRDRFTHEPIKNPSQYREIRKTIFEIDQFKYRNRHYLMKAIVDFYDLFNVFPQIILSEDRQKVTRIAAMEAAHCRYEKRKNGVIRKVYMHPDWTEWTGQKDDQKLVKVDCLEPLNTYPEELKERRGDTLKYIFPLSYPTGKNYYQLIHWWSLQVSGWYDFGQMIPELKAAILRNLALIRYHIEMPDYWMQDRYDKWNTMKAEERRKATQKEFKIVNDVLVGARNAGKSVMTMFKTGHQKDYAGWKITAVDDKMKDDAFLADSSESTIKVFSATSIDPSLHGLIPGKGGSNRSGSDKREALNIYMSLITPHEDIVLDPWQYTSWHNGWNNEDIETKWFLNKPVIQTLNQVSPAARETKIEENGETD